jgi:very-short-patch-repair endonuclease
LWEDLRSRRFQGFRFRRQVPIGAYIADFVCYGRKLIIELDGGQHSEDAAAEYDRRRDEALKQRGFTVLRIWNSELTENRNGVLESMLAVLQSDLGAPSSGFATFSHGGEKAKEPRPGWSAQKAGWVAKPQPLFFHLSQCNSDFHTRGPDA